MSTVADLYWRLDGMIANLRPTPGQELRLIDYAHRVGDTLYHATISNADGPVKSTWTYEEDGELVRRDRPMDDERFHYLWVALCRQDVFARCLSNDMDAPVDPEAHHVISFVYTEQGQPGRCVILVPADEPSADFARWLEELDIPTPGAS
jgi:hypothetical protein